MKPIFSECLFLVIAPWTQNAHPSSSFGPSPFSLSLSILPKHHSTTENHLLSLCMCNTPPEAPISSAALMPDACLLSSLKVMLGGRNGFFTICFNCSYNLHQCLQTLTESPFEPQNNNKELLSKTKGALSAEEQHEMQTYEPQGWTILLGQHNFFN